MSYETLEKIDNIIIEIDKCNDNYNQIINNKSLNHLVKSEKILENNIKYNLLLETFFNIVNGRDDDNE